MALSFPNSPTDGQIYTDSASGNRWSWDNANTVWKSTGTFTQTITVASTAPGSPAVGQLWWNQDFGRLLVYYNDGTSSQWVDASPSDATSASAYIQANASFGQANASFSAANTALQNTSVTLAGDLTITGNTTIKKKTVVNYTPATADNAAIYIASANTQGGTGYADFLKVSNIAGGTNPNKTFRLNSTGGIEVINSAYTANLFSIDDSGRVRIPYQPYCWVAHGSTVTYSNQLVQWSVATAGSDPYSMFSGSPNYRITVPVAGNYLVMYDLLLNSGSAGPLSSNIRKNGGALKRIYSSTGYTYQGASASIIVNCAANDYFDVFQDSGATLYGGDIGNFVVYLMG